jgi:hypothetical protein
MARMSSTELAYRILEREKRPMTPKDLIKLAVEDLGLTMSGKTPDATLNSNFINERKRRDRSGQEQRFVRIKPGHWGLVKYVGKHYEVQG